MKALLYSTARRILSSFPAFRKLIPHSLYEAFAERTLSERPDRRHLEEMILPCLAAANFKKVLFVGCRRYTHHYSRWFTGGSTEYWTTDIDPVAARWGSRGRHVICDVRDVGSSFPDQSLDLVLLNGVFGWGLDDEAGMNQAVEAIHRVLCPGGILMIGWDTGTIPDPCELPNVTRLFEHTALPGLPARSRISGVFLSMNSDHVYDFLVRR